EDGIRDFHVTGVQTCALPISALGGFLASISYNWIFYGNALGAFVATLTFVSFFYNRKGNVRPRETHAVNDEHPAVRSPYRDGLFLTFSLFCCGYAICFFQLLSTLPLFYQKGYGLDRKSTRLNSSHVKISYA